VASYLKARAGGRGLAAHAAVESGPVACHMETVAGRLGAAGSAGERLYSSVIYMMTCVGVSGTGGKVFFMTRRVAEGEEMGIQCRRRWASAGFWVVVLINKSRARGLS